MGLPNKPRGAQDSLLTRMSLNDTRESAATNRSMLRPSHEREQRERERER